MKNDNGRVGVGTHEDLSKIDNGMPQYLKPVCRAIPLKVSPKNLGETFDL